MAALMWVRATAHGCVPTEGVRACMWGKFPTGAH